MCEFDKFIALFICNGPYWQRMIYHQMIGNRYFLVCALITHENENDGEKQIDILNVINSKERNIRVWHGLIFIE